MFRFPFMRLYLPFYSAAGIDDPETASHVFMLHLTGSEPTGQDNNESSNDELTQA